MKGKRQKEKKFKWMKVVYTSRRKMEGPLQNARYELYPKITMEGRWLEELGFHVGDSILLEYGDGCIKIFPVRKAGWRVQWSVSPLAGMFPEKIRKPLPGRGGEHGSQGILCL